MNNIISKIIKLSILLILCTALLGTISNVLKSEALDSKVFQNYEASLTLSFTDGVSVDDVIKKLPSDYDYGVTNLLTSIDIDDTNYPINSEGEMFFDNVKSKVSEDIKKLVGQMQTVKSNPNILLKETSITNKNEAQFIKKEILSIENQDLLIQKRRPTGENVYVKSISLVGKKDTLLSIKNGLNSLINIEKTAFFIVNDLNALVNENNQEEHNKDVLLEKLSDNVISKASNVVDMSVVISSDILDIVDKNLKIDDHGNRYVENSFLNTLDLNESSKNQINRMLSEFNNPDNLMKNDIQTVMNENNIQPTQTIADKTISTINKLTTTNKVEALGVGCFQINPWIDWRGIGVHYSNCIKQLIINGGAGALFARLVPLVAAFCTVSTVGYGLCNAIGNFINGIVVWNTRDWLVNRWCPNGFRIYSTWSKKVQKSC